MCTCSLGAARVLRSRAKVYAIFLSLSVQCKRADPTCVYAQAMMSIGIFRNATPSFAAWLVHTYSVCNTYTFRHSKPSKIIIRALRSVRKPRVYKGTVKNFLKHNFFCFFFTRPFVFIQCTKLQITCSSRGVMVFLLRHLPRHLLPSYGSYLFFYFFFILLSISFFSFYCILVLSLLRESGARSLSLSLSFLELSRER